MKQVDFYFHVNMKIIKNIGSVVHHTSALPPMHFSLAIKKITMPPSHFSMIKNALQRQTIALQHDHWGSESYIYITKNKEMQILIFLH